MAEIEIRAALVEDAASIARVHVATWQHAYRGQMPDSFLDGLSVERRTQRWIEQLSNLPAKAHTLVAVDQGEVRGFCSLGSSRDDDTDGSTGEVYAIYVDPPSMGKGIGLALMAEAVRTLHSEGFARATLWVLASNTPSRHFYEHQGWSADGATKTEDQGDFVLHEVRYARPLEQA